MPVKTREALKTAYKAVDDKFGKDIIMLDIADLSVLADYFIIATANNLPQLRIIADEVEGKLTTQGLKLKHAEGYPASRWILLDFGSIIAHFFLQEEREFYSIERVWGDAKQILPEEL